MAYLRTSSMTNVGEGKDSDKRQRAAIEVYAKRAGYEIIGEHSDEGLKGSDPSGKGFVIGAAQRPKDV